MCFFFQFEVFTRAISKRNPIGIEFCGLIISSTKHFKNLGQQFCGSTSFGAAVYLSDRFFKTLFTFKNKEIRR